MVSLFRGNIVDLPTNASLNYFWCSGFMISSFLVIQVLSGFILSLSYSPESLLCFSITTNMILEGIFTWLVRYAHIWGVTFIFLLFFAHMGRALYYSSYSKLGVWNVGFVLYLLMMVEAFLGYVLPWHQMSYWAATVLTSIIKSIPFVGDTVFRYVVGHYCICGATLSRVYSAHVCLAFIILGVAVVHLFYLHLGGSNNPLYISNGYSDVVYFHSYYTIKDLYLFVVLFLFCISLMLIVPDFVLDLESFIEANPMVTPVSIKPEWYFLAFYAMLRSIESKIGGLVLVIIFLLVLWLPTTNVACQYCMGRQFLFWSIVSSFVGLSYLGACHPEFPFTLVSKLLSFLIIVFFCMFKVLWAVPYSSNDYLRFVS
uniref:Cytochrome b n=1 Tax=Posthodiplostomum centrarchi TaxID=1954244 RepID=A0A6J3YU58_9TREM|nr:cytochrome b [Posthodiplostomum centrarchi]